MALQHKRQVIRVWDPLLRIFHWLTVIAVLLAYWSDGTDLRVHGLAGSLLGGLLLFRLFWGAVGPEHARFGSFFPRYSALKAHFLSLLKGSPHRHLGHTPLGSVMIFLLLCALMFMYATGSLLLALQLDAGPWAGWVDHMSFEQEIWVMDLHERLADALMALVIVHIAGVLVESWLQKVNLVSAMFTGCKTMRDMEDKP